MVIINVKVKTLDSRNHDFTVDEEMTVKEFKEHISEKVEITADLQRLIYCGRVLNDEKPLKEYDVNGKCLHLVQRPPPSSNSSTTTTNNEGDTRRSRLRDSLPDFENLMMGSFSIPVPGPTNIVGPAHTTTSLNPSSTLCGNRITVARHMLQCADNIAAYLENPENGLNNQNMDLLSQQTMESTVLEVGISAVTDVDLPQQDVQNIVQAFQGAVSAAFRQNGINNITVQHNDPITSGPSGTTTSSSITIEFPPNIVGTDSGNSATSQPTSDQEPNQPQDVTTPSPAPPVQQEQPPAQPPPPQPSVFNTIPTSTGTTVQSGMTGGRRQQTTSTQTLGEVVGQMRTVQRRLDPFIQQYYDILQNDPAFPDDTARENAQRIFDRVSEALHYMSHAQHAISDLMLDLNLQTPRHLCCRPILVEQSAFVSSGISALPPVGSINIGPLFARGNINLSNNNQPNAANQGQNISNNNNNPSTINNNNTSNENMIPPSLFSAFGIPQPNPAQQTQQQPAAPMQGATLLNSTSSGTNTTNNQTTASSGANNQQDFDDAGDSPTSEDITGQNRNANNNERYRNFIQSIISSAGQPNAEVHIINANISIPVLNSLQNPNSNQNSSSTNGATSTSTPTENVTSLPETTQARVTTNTQPTTSTQTRSTSRPILTSTTLPPTSIRNFRPIPANNFLSSFDRFLPCNSHHIRDDQNQSQQQNQQTQTIHVRPQRRTVSLDRNSMRQAPANATIHIPTPLNMDQQSASSTIGNNRYRHFSGVNNITDDELDHRFNIFGIQISLRDLDSVTPNFYNTQRDGLRSYLMQNYFSNNEINDETISNATRDILMELEKYLERLSIYQHPDYDVRKSIENLIVKSLPFLINLIIDDESTDFGIRIERLLVTFFENVYMILVKCIGIRDTEKYLNDIANLIMTGEAARGNLSKFPAYVIQTFLIERRSYDLSEIQEFLIIKRPAPPIHETPMEVDDEIMEDAAMNIIEEEDEEDSSNAIQQEDLLNEPLPIIERSEPWHAQFPSNWLPIITRDISRQRRQSPQPAYSDAYITGMSSKRRKVLLSKKSSTNVQHLIADDVRSALHVSNKSGPSSSSGGGSSSNNAPIDEIVSSISNDPTIQNAYKDEVKGNISQRLKNDPDFEPEKYPNSSKYFK
ncbi:large proline-rich protein BAG6 isoform X4 [Chironomus tepperi]|uniref:large proline-rich protein BAG6 isoform X4 n=1 Tax=Chironomus tepperi TaxID=113505 RepID=UPI00391F0385